MRQVFPVEDEVDGDRGAVTAGAEIAPQEETPARLSVENIVHNEVTNEIGRIVRIVKVGGRLGYIVAKTTKPFGKETERYGDRKRWNE